MAVAATLTVNPALSCLSLGSDWKNDPGGIPRELFWKCYCLSATFSCCSLFRQGAGSKQKYCVSVSISESVKSVSGVQEILDLLCTCERLVTEGRSQYMWFFRMSLSVFYHLTAYKLHFKNYFEILPFYSLKLLLKS